MKAASIGLLAAMTLGVATASAQSNSAQPANDAKSPPAAAATTGAAPKAAAQTDATAFIDKEQSGLFRAPKLVGVAVYDSENKNVGKIDDLLLDHDGSVKAVVVGIGGFLGIGKKDVALPYSAVHWQTEARTVATSNPNPPANNSLSSTGGAANPTDNTKQATKTIAPAETEAYQGYPDRAVLDVTQAQLKSAPTFQYAENPSAKVTTSSDAAPATAPTPAKTP